jgi:conjugal transfer pilus assembly protein TraU
MPDAVPFSQEADEKNPGAKSFLKEFMNDAMARAKEEKELTFQASLPPQPEGKYLNPVTDICWKCLFPLHIGGIEVFEEKETEYSGDLLEQIKKWGCFCGPSHFGIPLSFWEPAMIVEVTPTPYKVLFWNGADFSDADSTKLRGGVAHVGESGRTSFYHVHYIPFPVFRLLGLVPGFESMKKDTDLIIPWWTEWDPTWRYPILASIFSMEMYKTDWKWEKACALDCAAANQREPRNDLWWCGGCLGSFYPFVGHVAHHIGGIQASSLLVHRALGKVHFFRWLLGFGTAFEEKNFCKKTSFPHLHKTQFKTQMLYPIPDKDKDEAGERSGYCHFLGQSPANWGAGKTYPGGGEDFSYIVWSKRNCCFNFFSVAKKFFTGGADIAIPKEIEDEIRKMPEKAFEYMAKDIYEDVFWEPWGEA